jgi:hypothetical protein
MPYSKAIDLDHLGQERTVEAQMGRFVCYRIQQLFVPRTKSAKRRETQTLPSCRDFNGQKGLRPLNKERNLDIESCRSSA